MKFKYKLIYKDSDIIVSFDSQTKSAIKKYLSTPPQGAFEKALDYFCQKFYPHIENEKRPWFEHRVLNEQLSGLERKKKDCGKETKEFKKLNEQIDKIIEPVLRPWPLAWYWKALFTAFPEFLTEKSEFQTGTLEIKISQIRQWVLVLVYKKELFTENGGGNKTTKILLRPPLFGRSERITNWDQYFTLLSLGDKIKKEWEDLKRREENGEIIGGRLDEEKAYIIGRHDLIYTIKPSGQIKAIENNGGVEIEISVDIKLKPYIGKYREDNVEDKFISERIIQDRHYPYDTVFIPTFENPIGDKANRKVMREGKEEEVLLTSDALCQTYETLSEIWNDRTTTSVLIISPPGSGKELLARSLYQFQKNEGYSVSYALSPSLDVMNYQMLYSRDFEDLEKRHVTPKMAPTLFEAYEETMKWGLTGKEPIGKDGKPEEPVHSIYDGLVFRARKGVLFLDEIDKVNEQTRASLLRLLENNVFALYGTPMILKLDAWRPLYVFAGSMNKKEMLSLKPLDFWTRISHIVVMEHPLDVGDQKEMKRIAKNYFWFFWQQRLLRFFEKSSLLPFNYDINQKKAKEFFENYYIGLFKVLSTPSVIDRLSDMFADEICIAGKSSRFSIRNIRSVTGLVRYALVDYFLYDKRSLSALGRIRETATRSGGFRTVKDKKLRWFEAIIKIISKEEQISNVSRKDPEELRNEIRSIVSSAIQRIYL